MAAIKARLPMFLLLGSVFLALVSVSVGFAYWEQENPKYHVCVKSCGSESDVARYLACHGRCKLMKETDPERAKRREEEKEEPKEKDDPEEERQQRKEREKEQERRRRQHEREQEQEQEEKRCREEKRREQEERCRQEEEEQERPYHRDPEERARERQRQREEEEKRREERRRCEEKEREEREGRREKREQEKEGEKQGSRKHDNPYHFRPNRFQTRFKNQHGRIRVLQRFDQRSEQLRGLQHYRVVEFESKPETFILPHHSDAEYLLIVQRGRAIVTVVNPNNRESYNIEQGDVLRIPAGATAYVANIDDDQNLRIVKLAIPTNIPGQFEDFYPSGNQNPKSYYSAFGRKTIEATFNAEYDEIQKVLFGEKGQKEKGKEHSEEEGVIVKVSREQIRELSMHAKSSPRGGQSLKLGPFNLRQLSPRYSNNNGKFYEARPEDLPPLQDLGVSVTLTELSEGALFLPHFNSRAIMVAQVVEGKGRLEIACPHLANQRSREQSEESEEEEEEEEEEEQEEEEEESEGQIRRLTARLSERDVFIIPAGHPVALRASKNSNLQVVAFGLNAENNQRSFLGGERDNVINQIERQVKELAFGGSGQEVEKLFQNQKESYFVNAQQQQKEGRKGRRVPLSSILGAFF